MNKVTVLTLQEMKKRGEKIAALTAYDASMARLLDAAGVEVVLVGDSVANVKLGHDTTLPVTLDEMVTFTSAVRRGLRRALLVADMPFLSYEVDPKKAVAAVGRLIKVAGAAAVKVEGGDAIAPTLSALIRANIPVMGHLGLTPQSVHRLGGYRVQGRTPRDAETLFRQAKSLEKRGVFALVLEAVPAPLARRITRALRIPTIGIGAGAACDGQILVLDDLLGLSEGPAPRFVKAFAHLRRDADAAVRRYRRDVKAGRFPTARQEYS